MKDSSTLALLTDFYELTMMQGYFFISPDEEAVFEMFFRKQPFNGGYTVFAGLKPLLDEIEKLNFSKNDLAYLRGLGIFKEEFLKYLSSFRFTGTIHSVPEGSVVFPNEPIMRITGNIMEAQLLESMILNFCNFQSLVATKTARITDAAGRDVVMEFGLRRAQGINGALSATRAAYIGGVSSTSNTLAGKLYGIDVKGTMAHSWISSFDSELDAFRKYIELYPDSSVLLVDTYDTLKSGVPNTIKVYTELKKQSPAMMAIRIDSGDLEYLSRKARIMLDKAGLEEVKIVASNEIDEWIIEQLKIKHAPVDSWGVGTKLVTGGNDPALTGVYKIAARKKAGGFEPCLKISNQVEKISNPGIKNIMRFYASDDTMIADLLFLEDEKEELLSDIAEKKPIRFNHPLTEYAGFTLRGYHTAKSLLEKVMCNGKIIKSQPELDEISTFCRHELNALDKTYRRLLNPHAYRISLSNRLKQLKTDLINAIQKDYENH